MPTIPPPIGGVDRSEWDVLVERGRADGELHADDVAHVLREAELTGDALHAVHAALTAAGIRVDDTVSDDDEDDATPPRGASREVVIDDDDVERLLSRRRR